MLYIGSATDGFNERPEGQSSVQVVGANMKPNWA
jgi:hypothetical protein